MYNELTMGPGYKEIKNVTWPERQDPRLAPPDVILIEIKRPFRWSARVQPACLPESEFVPKYEGILMVSARLLLNA